MRRAILVGLTLLVANPAPAQEPLAPIRGVVVTPEGKPVAGADVYGDYWKQCCPAERESLKTAADGSFAFVHATTFIHLRNVNFQPQTILLSSGQHNVRIVVADANATAKELEVCPPPERGRIRVGDYLQFTLPAGVKIKKYSGVDTVSFLVEYPRSKERMRIESGPLLGGTDADERLLLDSSIYSERWISAPGLSGVGIDSSGKSKAGKNWRWFGSPNDTAVYVDATDEAAKYFDTVIEGACLAPFYKALLDKASTP